MLLMGKSTISTGPFSIAMLVYQRVTMINWLVVTGTIWNMNLMTFHSVGNFIIPTDELIFFKGVETTKQLKVAKNDS